MASVCKKVLGAILEDTPKDIDAIDDAIDSYCKAKRMNSKDKKICYYIKSIKRKVWMATPRCGLQAHALVYI